MQLIFIWITVGVICGVIASNKGHSGSFWFFIGLFLGPVGLILALVLSRKAPIAETIKKQKMLKA